jgi:hypothetical protein
MNKRNHRTVASNSLYKTKGIRTKESVPIGVYTSAQHQVMHHYASSFQKIYHVGLFLINSQKEERRNDRWSFSFEYQNTVDD